MIIFYNKKTGDIVGTIGGRINSPEEMNMWIGEKDKTDRIVVAWKPVRWYNQKGEVVSKDAPDVFTADFEPDHPQKDLFVEIDKNRDEIFNYKVDIKSKKLIRLKK